MTIYNHTSHPDQIIHKMITTALEGYDSVFDAPNANILITVCRDKKEFNKTASDHTGESAQGIREYNGVFLCPHEKTDTLHIVLLMKDEYIKGAEQFFYEAEHGSQRDTGMTQAQFEERGLKIAKYCRFAETIQHEYSHLCSFERLMEVTDDIGIPRHSMDYHLYDEEIATYRGNFAMLRMMEPYLERDLIYTMWMHDWNESLKSFKSEGGIFIDYLKRQKIEIEEMMIRSGLTGERAVLEMEYELGHPLEHGGKLTKRGLPELSILEVAEFMMFDDFGEGEEDIADYTKRTVLPLIYFAKNPYASYQGAQLVGLVHAYHDFLLWKTGREIPERQLDLLKRIDVPYYETVDIEGTKKEFGEYADLIKAIR